MFGSSIISSVTSHLANAGNFITHGLFSAGEMASLVAHAAANEVKSSVSKAQGLWNKAEEDGESVVLHTSAGKMMTKYAPLLSQLQQAFTEASHAHPEALIGMKEAAQHKEVTPHLTACVQQITSHPAMSDALSEASAQSFACLGIEFGGAVELLAGADLALGLAVGIPYTKQIGITGTAGFTAGAEVGGDVQVALSLNIGSPKESGGPFVAIMVEGDLDIGGGGSVSFNLPDFSFGGISVNGSAGEEIKLSGGVGYTSVLSI